MAGRAHRRRQAPGPPRQRRQAERVPRAPGGRAPGVPAAAAAAAGGGGREGPPGDGDAEGVRPAAGVPLLGRPHRALSGHGERSRAQSAPGA